MKRKLLSAAVGAALSAAVSPALALLPSAYNPATANETFVSGASAQEGQLLNWWRYACQAGTLDVYRRSNQFIFFCTPDPVKVPGLAKPDVVVYKSSVGGSGNGVDKVAQGATLQFMNIATLSTTSCGAPTVVPATAGGLIAYNEYSNCSTTNAQNVVTEVGMSDVEPNLFVGILPGFTQADANSIPPKSINQLIFGVPVTKALRDALQGAQGLSVGAEDEANMPSLSKSQVTSIYTGSLPSPTWDNFGLNNAADPVNAIWVARRVNSSGTQTSARVHFLNDPCAANMAGFVTDETGNPDHAGDAAAVCGAADPLAAGFNNVYQGSGSGNVTTCMQRHNQNSRWAVGVLSTEFVPVVDANPAVDSGYRHIKIDGVAPTLYSAAQGRYHYVMEATMQWRASLAGDDLVVAQKMVDGFNNPVVISAINSGLVQPYGPAGILGVPGANAPTDPITTANIVTNPVSAFTKSASGTTNNCQPLQAIKPGSKTGFAN